MHSLRVVGVSFACGLLCACATDDPDPSAGTSGQTAGDETAAGTTTGAATGAMATTDEGADSSSGGEPLGVPAAGGIKIDYIEANQGIGVKIGENGKWVGAEGRTAPLAAKRLTLVRVFWKVPDDWTPREIEGRVTFYLPDGSTVSSSETKLVEDDSFVGSLAETFNFGLQPEDALPGTGYSVELYEVDASFSDPAVTAPPRLPADEESVLVGLEDSDQRMQIVLVPFNLNNGGACQTEPDISDATMQLYWDKMFQMNPLDSLELIVHDPIEWTQPLTSLSQLNQVLSTLRFDEGAPPEAYYYGHVDVCSGGLDGAAGLAFGIPDDPTMDNAYLRVSSGVSDNPELSAETFVHEVGHSQGRRHVACDGEAGIDPSYPQEGGAIGEWGFGVVDLLIRHPTVTKDYMTYCSPTWVSNFGWNLVWPTIKTLSAWSPAGGADQAPDPQGYGEGSLLVGTLLSDGQTLWHTVPGSLDTAQLTDDVQIEFSANGERVALHGTRVQTMPDSNDRLLVTPLPGGFEAVDQMTQVVGAQRTSIPRASVVVTHHKRAIKR